MVLRLRIRLLMRLRRFAIAQNGRRFCKWFHRAGHSGPDPYAANRGPQENSWVA
jgi:hypothetical protein